MTLLRQDRSEVIFSMRGEHVDNLAPLDYLKRVGRIARDSVCVTGVHYHVGLPFAVDDEPVYS